MDANEHLRREIKAQLVKVDMKQAQLAEQLDMSRSSLSNILSGDVALLTVNATRILDALGLELKVQPKR